MSENIFHYGKGSFGYKVVQKNEGISYSWFETKAERDSSFEKSKRKTANTVSIVKVTR